MGENVRISKWGVMVFVSLAAIAGGLLVQTALAFKWAGQMSADMQSIQKTVNETRTDLTRRIERIEDRENRHNPK